MKIWRRGSGSNRRIKVLQTSPLPLGYRAPACKRVGYASRTKACQDKCTAEFEGIVGAGDRGRTGDIFLGKEALYH